MKNSVTQQDNFGCGAACVAFVTNKPYSEVVHILGKHQATTKGFMGRELAHFLNIHRTYQFRYIKPSLRRNIFQEGTIVFIKRSKQYPYGHYIARHNGQWMDPWINLLTNNDISQAKSGFRKRLPGKAVYALLPV